MRRRLQRIYWSAIAITALLCLLSVTLLILFRIEDRREALRSALQAASAWTLDANNELQSHARNIAEVSPPLRVTFLLDSGLVLADSDEEPMAMGDHLNRPEVQAALRGELGESMRFSDTQSVYMIYAAKQIAPRLILRLGYPIEMITHALMMYSVGVVVLFVVLHLFLRRALTRITGLLTRQMDDVRRMLEEGGAPQTAVFPEFQPAMDNIAYLAGRLKSDLAEINRTLSLRNDFVANASHELRSPLTSIMGFAEMLDEGLADTPEEREICVQTIRSECRRMLDVVEDVLMLSRAERSPQQDRAPVRLSRVAEEICQALAPQAAQKRISLRVEGDMQIEASEKDIWEILHNLTSNAIRYGVEGGHAVIRLGEGRMQVEDDGIGIAREHLPHLFEQFYRVDQSRDASVPGTGLGLSIVRTLAARNGGRVDVESEPGRGSRFIVYFDAPGEGGEEGAE